MAEVLPLGRPTAGAGFVLGRKLDSIPFSAYHVSIITVCWPSSALLWATIW